MTYLIRKASFKDLEVIYEIEKLCFPVSQRFPFTFYKYLLNNKNTLFFIIEQKGHSTRNSKKIMGFIVVESKMTNIYEILTLNIHPDYRRKGYGNKLMEFIENKLISQHQSQEKSSKLLMTLVVAVNNIPAINLYKKRGYTIIKKIMGYYSSNEDGYLMVKKLQS